MIDEAGDEAMDEEEAIERGQGVALWRQIDRSLSREIASGNWQPGEKLPTEQALSARFGVNRHTIRRAIQAMVQRGLLRVEQGRGTFVQEGIIDYVVGRRTRFTENILRNRRHPSYEVLQSGELLPPLAVARQLKLAARAPVVMVERLSSAGGSPISLSTMYFPAARFAGIDKVHARTGSVTEALKHFGVADYTRAVTRLTARLPTAEEARHLKQSVTRPVLLSEAVDIDPAGVPIAVNITRFASDRVQIVFGAEAVDGMPQPDLPLSAR